MRRRMSSWGFTARLVESVDQALVALDERLPDVVVADVLMPGKDGCDLCLAVKSDPRRAHIPVLLVTQLSSPDDIMRGLESGADGYMLKPYDPGLLRQRLEELVRRPRDGNGEDATVPVEVELEGRRYRISANRRHVIPMLMSTFESALAQQRQLRNAHLELTRANQELMERNAELGHAAERQNVLLGMAVHDLRSPLAVTIGYADFMLTAAPELPANCSRLLEEIRRSSRSVVRLVEDLLDLSALESGKLLLKKQPMALHELCRRVVALHQVMGEKDGVQLALELAPDVPATFQADPQRLEQVLNQLLSNALKHSPPGSNIRMSLKCPANCLRVEVADQGHGMDEARRARLFQPILKEAGYEHTTGLELAITKKVVEAHGGQIGVESQPGQGSTFWLELPCEGSGGRQ